MAAASLSGNYHIGRVLILSALIAEKVRSGVVSLPDFETRLAARTGWSRLSASVRGSLWVLLAALMFSLMAVFVKIMGNRLDSFQVAFFRALFGLMCILPFALAAGPSILRTRRLPLHLLRGTIGMAAMFAGFYSLAHLPLADATALSFTKPLFLTVLASVLLGERIRRRRITATIVGFLGVVLILRPGAGAIQPAAFVALFGALSVAFVVVTVKKLVRTESGVTVLIYFGVISTAIAAVPAAFVWQTPTPQELLLLLLIGFLGASAQSCMIRGYQAADATAVSSLDYSRMLYAIAFGYAIFGELPDAWSLCGALVIILSAIYIVHRERQLGHNPPAPLIDRSPIRPTDVEGSTGRNRDAAE